MSLVASGTVRVRSLATGIEWDEIVEVFEQDLEDTDGSELTVEDSETSCGEVSVNGSSRSAIREVARRVAQHQACEQVETLACDLS
jgi:hypothetical protein